MLFTLPPISQDGIQALAAALDAFVRANGVQAAAPTAQLAAWLQQAQPIKEDQPNGDD